MWGLIKVTMKRRLLLIPVLFFVIVSTTSVPRSQDVSANQPAACEWQTLYATLQNTNGDRSIDLKAIDPSDGTEFRSIPISNAEHLSGLTSFERQLLSIDGWNDGQQDRTFRIYRSSGDGRVIGHTGYNWNFRSIELNPQTGLLYGLTDNALYTIGQGSGAATFVASLSDPVLHQATALAIDDSGQAFISDIMSKPATPGIDLFQLDLATGELNHLGDLDIPQDFGWFNDLAFDQCDRLWAVFSSGGLYDIDTSSVAATLLYESEAYEGIAFGLPPLVKIMPISANQGERG